MRRQTLVAGWLASVSLALRDRILGDDRFTFKVQSA
jgi:hypothetical protein